MPEITETDRPQRRKKRRQPKPGDPVTMPAWLFFPFSISTLAAAFIFFRRGDPIAAATVLEIALFGWIGFRMGFGRISATVLAFLAAISLAPSLGIRYESQFSNQFGTTGLTNRFLCIAVIGVLISLAVTLLVTMISSRILAKRRLLNLANSFLGFAIGLVEGAAVAVLLTGGLLSMQMWQRGFEIDNNKTAQFVDRWAAKTRQSAIGPIVRDYNPFEKIKLFSDVGEIQHSIRNLSDPTSIQRMLDDPGIAEMRSDPKFAAAIDEVRRDPAIKDVIDKGLPLDGKALMRLMSSPSVMHLVDQPEFRRRVRKVTESH
jgi:uncharacterized membrane protein required for colicin V production